MRHLSLFCLTISLLGCTAFTPLSREEEPPPALEPHEFVAADDYLEAPKPDEAQSPMAETRTVTITPATVRKQTPKEDVARTPVPGTEVRSSTATDRVTGQPKQAGTYDRASPAAPRPYGHPTIQGVTSKTPTVTSAPASAATVEPNTTLLATPSTYEKVAEPTPPTVDPAFARALTGLWVNTTDPLEVVEFTPTHYVTFYDGEALVEEPMRVHQRCPNTCTDGQTSDRGCFTVAGPAGIDCFGIVRLSATELELQLLGVSEQTVTYRRR